LKYFLIFLYSLSIFATPKNVEVIFLSPAKPKKPSTTNLFFTSLISKKIAFSMDNCQPMEGGCFHPQLGFVEDKEDHDKKKEEQQRNVKLKTINSLDTNMIDCKEGNYFDIFCGKAKPVAKQEAVDLEIWIDTSSSLRNFDWDGDPSHCSRRSFVERLQKNCSLEVKVFDTSIKQMGDLSSLCVTYGLNDQKRFIRWIEDSNAERLIIVTDIDEASTMVRDYLFKIGGKLYGADYGDFDGEKLVNYVTTLETSCQKKKK